jgi:hypothetical protein
MAVYEPRGEHVVDAFQWLGGSLADYADLPFWAKGIALHTPGDGSLNVPLRAGTSSVMPGQWVMISPDGGIDAMPDARFREFYDVEKAEKQAMADARPKPAPVPAAAPKPAMPAVKPPG